MINIFNENTCLKCGICLKQCPIIQMPIDQAKEEIIRMIETKESKKIINECTGCSYCDIICPTESNPSDLRREIRLKNYCENGVRCTGIITEDMPYNLMSIGFEIDKEQKELNLIKYENPPKSDSMFYLGCGISYFYQELTNTKLFDDFPLIGGMKYCCSSYAHSYFGEIEGKIKGLELYEKLKTLGVNKLITFCPGCDTMIRDIYPSILEDFNIKNQTIIEYLIEKYHKGEFTIKNKINKRITFQDPCTWRRFDKKIYDTPREFLEILGAEVVEMEYNREHSHCCGLPVSTTNRALASKLAEDRISEAQNINAEVIAHICTGCLSNLSTYAIKRNIKSYYITELAQMAIGETPTLKIIESKKKTDAKLIKTVMENPKILSEKYIIKNGKIILL
ncbi:MAG: (Fe-S)-binding protein [Candidatus Lokiarchaeota archaeon]|nr:(Fe-S)-binding protein [Candidatus Lokiarchaeota archaeon]